MNLENDEVSDRDFGLRLTSGAVNDLEKLDDHISDQLKNEIITLVDNPTRGEIKGGKLKNFRAFEPYVDRKESYRIGYALISIQDEPWISIVLIGKREDFYERLERRVESFNPDEFI
mgnify:CR=1 FL=1